MKDILKRSNEKPQIAFRYQPATVFDLCNESGKYLSNYIICQHGKLLLNEFLLNMDYKKDYSDSNVSPFYEFSFDDNDKHEMMYS